MNLYQLAAVAGGLAVMQPAIDQVQAALDRLTHLQGLGVEIAEAVQYRQPVAPLVARAGQPEDFAVFIGKAL